MKVPTIRATLALTLVLMSLGSARAQLNFDRRVDEARARALTTPSQSNAIEALGAELESSLTYSLDEHSGVTRTLYHPTGYLTEPSAGDPEELALDFVRSNLALLGLEPDDLGEYEVTDSVHTVVTGATHVYLRQRYLGLPVFNAQLQVHVNREGRIVSINNAFVPGLAGLGKSAMPRTSAAHAVSSAARHLGRPLARSPRLMGQPLGSRRGAAVEANTLSSRVIEAELMWLPMGRNVELVWRFQLHSPDGQHIYDMTVSAESRGSSLDDGDRVLTRFDWVSSSQYEVYALPVESPIHTSPSPPSDARTLVADPEEALASPEGWHDAGKTIMDGNNVHAYLDRNGNNAPDAGQPSCGSSLECIFPINLNSDPVNSTSAAVANLFYWNNIIHDVQYQYGFDEAGGNFQENNFGRGGGGSDSVNAEAQDNAAGNSRCNANFSTPTDGANPRMQMFVCNNASPQRDGDFDNGVVIHEYGHGISIRQVGGPGNSSCLSNAQQGGEGWSDFFALVYTAKPGDSGEDARGVGSYLFGLPADGSIRPQRYSTDPAVNNYSYESIDGVSVPHGVGSVWAQALWEVYWSLVDQYGFDPDLYNALGGAGNQRALLYVNEGLKNTACSPTFTEARDGVIQAATDSFAGEDVCLLWETFAAYGLGVNAVSGGSNSTNPTNGFDLPAACQTPLPAPVCPAGTIDFSSFSLEAYTDQDASGSVSVEHNGDTLLMEGNRWRRSTQSYNVVADTEIRVLFQSGSQGEIHGIGFDEDQTLTNDLRVFQFWGTQDWGGAIQFKPRYSSVGDFESFTIPVGQFYTGSDMRLVFVNDKDSGTLNNLGRFACVDVVTGTPPPNTPPAVLVTAPVSGSSVDEGTAVAFAGVANDAEDGDLSGALVWSSNLAGAIGAGASFSTTLGIGTHVVTASVTDSGTLPGADVVNVIVNPAPPVVTITAPANGSSFTQGTSVTFSGTAIDIEDGDLSSTLAWTSDLDGSLGTGGSFATSTLSLGAHTITAGATDVRGLAASATIDVTINPIGGGCTDCVDWNVATVAYSNQDRTGSVEVLDDGDTITMAGNRWRRTTQTFNITPESVIEFEFMSTSEGEIHGIGFDEDDSLTNNIRIFEIFGTQNWGGAFQFAEKYTPADLGTFRTFRVEVGQFYTGSSMSLVVVNDKDAGPGTNTSAFRNVRVFEEAAPACATVLHETDFETGASGWLHDAAASTCTTGVWGVGDPDGIVNGGVTTQLEDDHTVAGVNALFTEPNTGGAGTNDVDGGSCAAVSPLIDASAHASVQVSFWYYHGQRDAGDDPAGDFFRVDVSNDNGATYGTNVVSMGDVTSNAAWTRVTTLVPNPGQLRIRVQASDGAGPGDLVEAALDDIRVCALPKTP